MIYDRNFYLDISASARSSAEVIVPKIVSRTKCSSIIDLGCGDSSFIKEFLRYGIQEVKGIEGNWILNAGELGSYPWIQISDLSQPLEFHRKYDVAVCLEVAEHLESQFADTIVQNLVSASDQIFFSAAIPGQGGTNHVNLQYPDYWAEKFLKHGFAIEWDPREEFWKERMIAPWYKQNCLLFKRQTNGNLGELLPKTLFHPEIFPELQSFPMKLQLLINRILKRVLRIAEASK